MKKKNRLSVEESESIEALINGKPYLGFGAEGKVFYNLGEKIEEGALICKQILLHLRSSESAQQSIMSAI